MNICFKYFKKSLDLVHKEIRKLNHLMIITRRLYIIFYQQSYLFITIFFFKEKNSIMTIADRCNKLYYDNCKKIIFTTQLTSNLITMMYKRKVFSLTSSNKYFLREILRKMC